MTDLDRPMGLRTHLRLAAASCEGRGIFHEGDGKPGEAAVWNALADLFYEAAEQDDHDTPLGRALIESADRLINQGDDEPSGVTEVTDEGRRAVNAYRAHRTRQNPHGTDGSPT